MTDPNLVRSVRKLGLRGAQFLSRDVRRDLEIGVDDKNATSRMHNGLRGLVRDEVIELIPSDTRKRNKYYRIKDEARLRAKLIRVRPDNGSAPASPAAGGLARIEEELGRLNHRVDERLDEIQTQLDQLLAIWS